MIKLNLKNSRVKKIVIACLLVVALVIQISFLSYLFKAIVPDSDKEDENVVMTYTSNGNIDYKVYLRPNEFIKEEYIGPGEAYILDLIDHVQIIPTYGFKSSEKTNVTGTNKLVARLKVYYKESSSNNSEILKREVVLDEKLMNFNESQYSSTNSYDLNLDYYLNILKEFQSSMKISMEGYVEVSYETSFNGKVGGASYNDEYSNMIRIPLSTSVIKIDKESSKEKTSKVYEADLIKTNKTVLVYVVAVNLVVFAIICILLKQLFIFTNKNEYQRTIGKLLKDYDDIIVNTSTIIDTSDYKVIEINEFKEILNLSRELLLPIMNYEVIKGSLTWFYVIKDDILYRYIVSANKLEKEKKQKDEKSFKNKLPKFNDLMLRVKEFFINLFHKLSDLLSKLKNKLSKKNKDDDKE